METPSLSAVLLRRWPVVLVVLLCTVIAVVALHLRTPPEYQAQGRVLFVVPVDGITPTGEMAKINPYLFFNGSLNLTATALTTILDGAPSRRAVEERGGLSTYRIGQDNNQTPFVGVTATGNDRATVLSTIDLVLEQIRLELDRLQRDAPKDQRIQVTVLTEPEVFAESSGAPARTAIVLMGLGAAAAVGGALSVERFATGTSGGPGRMGIGSAGEPPIIRTAAQPPPRRKRASASSHARG